MTMTLTLRDAITAYIHRALAWFEEWRAAERAEADQLKDDGYRLVTYRDTYKAWMLPWGPCGYQPWRCVSTVIKDYYTSEVVGVQVARSETEDLNTSARVRDEWEANHWAPYGDGFDVHVPDTPPFADLGLTERQARDVIDTITDACASLIVTLTGLPGDEVTQALADWDGRPAEDDYSYSEHRLAWLTALAKRPSGQNSTVA